MVSLNCSGWLLVYSSVAEILFFRGGAETRLSKASPYWARTDIDFHQKAEEP
jgi:hypothetical protein